jgi:hypothetical protein
MSRNFYTDDDVHRSILVENTPELAQRTLNTIVHFNGHDTAWKAAKNLHRFFPREWSLIDAISVIAFYANEKVTASKLINSILDNAPEDFLQKHIDRLVQNKAYAVGDLILEEKNAPLCTTFPAHESLSPFMMVFLDRNGDEKALSSFFRSCLDHSLISDWVVFSTSRSGTSTIKNRIIVPDFDDETIANVLVGMELKPYLILVDSEWMHIDPRNYISIMVDVFSSNPKVAQVVFSDQKKDGDGLQFSSNKYRYSSAPGVVRFVPSMIRTDFLIDFEPLKIEREIAFTENQTISRLG